MAPETGPILQGPARSPRDEPSLEKYGYFDHETVVQPDGRRAAFTWDSRAKMRGWEFSHWTDAHGFILLEGSAQIGQIAQRFLRSEIKPPAAPKKQPWWKRTFIARWIREWLRRREAKRQLRRFSKFVFPVIKGVMPELITPDLFSVQPMTAPLDSTIKFEVVDGVAEKKSERETLEATLGPGEILREYSYGGPLCGRGGYFVVHQSRPGRVLRYMQTWMS